MGTAPQLVSTFPADGSNYVPGTTVLELTFDEQVMAGSGSIEIHNSTDGSLVESIAITDPTRIYVNTSTDTVVVYQDASLLPGHSYYVTMASGVIDDTMGDAFAGISSPSTFAFTVSPTIDVTNGIYNVLAGQSVSVTAGINIQILGFDLIDYPAPTTVPGLTNSGSVTVSASGYGNATGIADDFGGLFAGSVVWNKAGASIAVTAVNGVALGFTASEFSSAFVNDGTFGVTSLYISTGVSSPDPNASFTNNGIFSVTNTGLTEDFVHNPDGSITPVYDGQADGVIFSKGGSFVNTGTFKVSGAGPIEVQGVRLFGDFSFDNSGTITITNSNAQSIAVSYATSAPSVLFTNSGLISADIAFWEVQEYYPQGPNSAVIDNTGTIDGAFIFNYAFDLYGVVTHTINNTGTIAGDIYFGPDGDAFNGASGTYNGTIYGGAGNDRFVLGAGVATVVYGGGGQDIVTLSGNLAAYSVTRSAGITSITGAGVHGTISGVYAIQFADQTLHTGAIVPTDFNGDGNADILWRNASTGAVQLWQMDGATKSSDSSVATVGTAWSIAGTGDFNGDGRADMLWRNASTGAVQVWMMSGAAIVREASLGAVSAAWSVAGIGDFNGDGQSDILWRNATTGAAELWLMSGGAVISDTGLGTVSTAWSVAATGDFNGDGQADILWRNNTTGAVQLWEMNGHTVSADVSLGTVSTGWSIAGSGDFNGDGFADILWRNNSTGAVRLWTMDGSTIISDSSLGTVSAAWSVAEIGDFNSDGMSDILWRNASTGALEQWTMNGTAIKYDLSLGTVSTNWSAQSLLATTGG